MTLRFDFFYENADKEYFLALLQKLANACNVDLRVESSAECVSIFASAESGEILGKFADILQAEVPHSLYFKLKEVNLCKQARGEKIAMSARGDIFSVSDINAIKDIKNPRFCKIYADSANSASCKNAESALDSALLKSTLQNLCDALAKGQSVALNTSRGEILLSIKSNDFDFILANDIATLNLYARASQDEISALASFEKPLIELAIKEVFAREIGAKSAKFILPYDIILCCLSSMLLEKDIAFVRAKFAESSAESCAFFEIVVGQNGYFLHKNYLDSADFAEFLNINFGTQSSHICYSERSEESKKNPFVILSEAKYLNNNRDSSVATLPQNDNMGLISSLRLRSAQNDKQWAEDDNLKKIAESSVDSANIMIYLSLQNPSIFACAGRKIANIAFDKNPKNILQKISHLENGDKLIANFKKAFEARYEAILALDSAPQWTHNLLDIFECATMILGCECDKSVIFDLAQNYLRDIGPKIDFKSVKLNSSLDMQCRTQSAESSHIFHSQSLSCHYERSEESKKNPFVILSEAKYLKDKNRDSSATSLPQNDNLKRSAESSADSVDFSQGGLPRRFCESARNDEFLDSSVASLPQNDKIMDCHADSVNLLAMTKNKDFAESANKTQQTIEEIAVEVAEFLGDFECKTGLKSAKHSKSPKSPQDAPKTKLQTNDFIYDELRTIRSIISFTLAGSEPEVIAFGIIESLADYLVLLFREAQNQFGAKNIAIAGDLFANKVFFDKITKKIPTDFKLIFPKYLDISSARRASCKT